MGHDDNKNQEKVDRSQPAANPSDAVGVGVSADSCQHKPKKSQLINLLDGSRQIAYQGFV